MLDFGVVRHKNKKIFPHLRKDLFIFMWNAFPPPVPDARGGVKSGIADVEVNPAGLSDCQPIISSTGV
ncbi:hypothetical protein DSCOOX_30000 [Desulfosarcina ovata subsp. ovata]|uniref:Uncharacterized protein n=1 Tax=Desulfosarcina ovata subsp. ovata TaxID=2752305 RepID=A0A5K8AD05_9BACT|nr:hypothetical protein DSCOOX_30000 [Desulfosarcina ovata subsp. ovata]